MSETTANPTSTEPRTPLDLVLPLEHQRINGRDAYELLLVLVQRMAMAPDLTAQLLTLIDIATQVLQADRGTIFLNDPETRELSPNNPLCTRNQ